MINGLIMEDFLSQSRASCSALSKDYPILLIYYIYLLSIEYSDNFTLSIRYSAMLI